MESQPVLKGLEELDWFTQIRDWERLTETGDRAELSFLPDSAELWGRLDARRETCTGQKCADFNRCFINAMHQRAADADVIIVNHHLFFADLALRQDDFGSILPEYSAVIFDEAHEIEDVASDYFGRQVSNYRFEELARDAEQTLRVSRQGGPPLLRRVSRLRDRVREFFEAFPPRDGRSPFETTARAEFLERHSTAYEELLAAVKAVESAIAALAGKTEELTGIARRAAELRVEIKFLLESTEKNYVYWFERRGKGVFLAATPIDVSTILRERLFEAFDTVVLTSATLAVGGHFDFLKQRLGIHTARERVLPHEFDFKSQALLYVPAGLPDVRDASFRSEGGCRDWGTPGMHRGTRVLLVYQLQPDESNFRAGAREVALSLVSAGYGTTHGIAGTFPDHAGRRALRHFKFLAGRRCPWRSTLLRDCGPFAFRCA